MRAAWSASSANQAATQPVASAAGRAWPSAASSGARCRRARSGRRVGTGKLVVEGPHLLGVFRGGLTSEHVAALPGPRVPEVVEPGPARRVAQRQAAGGRTRPIRCHVANVPKGRHRQHSAPVVHERDGSRRRAVDRAAGRPTPFISREPMAPSPTDDLAAVCGRYCRQRPPRRRHHSFRILSRSSGVFSGAALRALISSMTW